MRSINCKGKLIELNSPRVMGIMNLTPDSFYDGGRLKTDQEILLHAEKLINESATFIDIGGYSSRPNAEHISEKEELQRVIPVINTIIDKFPNALISIDTFRSKVAKYAIQSGACMINDISAGNMDEKMFKTVAELQVPYIIMHMKGTPQTMQKNPTYVNIIQEVIYYFTQKISELRSLGVNDLIVDVGFGFGKTIQQNYTLLKNLSLFKSLEVPILTGVSRKSMLYKIIDASAQEALNVTTVANTIALMNGTDILRVHDVKETIEAIKIINALE